MVDQPAEAFEMCSQSPSALCRESIPRHWFPFLKFFPDRNVAAVLEPSQMGAQAAVCLVR